MKKTQAFENKGEQYDLHLIYISFTIESKQFLPPPWLSGPLHHMIQDLIFMSIIKSIIIG